LTLRSGCGRIPLMAAASRDLGRFAPLVGILAVVLWVVGIVIIDSTDDPDEDAPASAYLDYYNDESGQILIGGFIFMLGALAFLWFVAHLRARLGTTTSGSAAAFAGGIGAGVCLLLLPAPDMTAALRGEEDSTELSGEAAQTFNNMADIFFLGAELSAALLLAAVGFLAVVTRVLPRWLGWLSLLFALLLLIPPIGWAALLFAVPVWVLVVSVLLFLAPRRAVDAT
jgi:hypothetical protein